MHRVLALVLGGVFLCFPAPGEHGLSGGHRRARPPVMRVRATAFVPATEATAAKRFGNKVARVQVLEPGLGKRDARKKDIPVRVARRQP